MPPPPKTQALVKTRSSCDRCHAQKLRCEKAPGLSRCRRCAKLGAVCRYSPRSARHYARVVSGVRPVFNREISTDLSHVEEVQSQSLQTGFPAVDLTFWSLSEHPHGCLSDSWNLACNNDSSFSNTLSSPSVPWDTFTNYPCPLSQVLANIPESQTQLTLNDQFRLISSRVRECAIPILSQPSNTDPVSCSPTSEKRNALTIVLDDLFRLTRDFIDALDTITWSILHSHNAATEHEPILSCYASLERIHTAILGMMLACANHATTPSLQAGLTVTLPRMDVGGVSLPGVRVGTARGEVPSKATSSLYMNTVSAVMAQLWERMAAVLGQVMASSVDGSPWVDVSEGTNRLVMSVTELRSSL